MLAQITKWVHQGPLNSWVLTLINSTWSLMLGSLLLGAAGTLGFAPYHQWVILLISLSFEIFLLTRLRCKKHVFFSLWLYFTALNALTLEWLNFVMTGFGELPLLVAWLIELIFSAYLSLFHALLGTLAFALSLKRLKAAPAPAAVTTGPQVNEEKDEEDDEAYDDSDAMPMRGMAALMNEPKSELTGGALPGWVPNQDHLRDASIKGYPCFKLGNKEVRFYKNVFALCFLPLALICADFIIGWLFSGFPWMYLGYGMLDSPFSAYAPLVGVRGLSLLIMGCAGALALTVERSYVYLPIAGMLFLLALFTQGMSYVSADKPVTMAGVQGNIAQAIKWDPRNTLPTIDKYLNLTTPLLGKHDLIIWPESALPVFIGQIQPLMEDLNRYAHELKSPVLIGIQRHEPPCTSFNSMFLLGQDEDFNAAQHYDKRALVPFGETIPFEQHLRDLGPLFNFPMSSFTKGKEQQNQFQLTLSDNRTLHLVPIICYESIFPELIAKSTDENTSALIMVSNDSWYGDTRGPEEHLAIARMRALELQKPMMRVTNSGITAYIDAQGKVVKRLEQNVAGVLEAKLVPTKGQTPYGHLGNIPLFILMALTLGLGLYLRRREVSVEKESLQGLVRP